jgi:hypothetical protein
MALNHGIRPIIAGTAAAWEIVFLIKLTRVKLCGNSWFPVRIVAVIDGVRHV